MHVSARAEQLFNEARTLDPETRARFVTDACGSDAELLEEVNSLLAAADQSDAFFSALAGKVSLAALAGDEAALPENTVLGQWRLVRLLGSGGMGSVYLAERADGQFEQRAALKILPMGMRSSRARGRFLVERQILARLVHDNIARLLDGGVTGDGVPYFVMDYVDGIAIDRYCEERGLPVAERVRLVLDVADAVQYAHRNLVVHRDLKPGNVLVEAGGRVRLLDFGIAKVLEPGADAGEPTQVTQRPATPAYASPEMLRGEPVDVSTDVYSIGALLYRLLTGRVPLDFEGLGFAAMHERAASDVPNPASWLNAAVDADLDAVLSKALAKDTRERYPSVESLANDLGNWLDGRPVTARPPSRLYRAGKFVARHRAGVAAGTLAVLALVTIAGVATWAAITAERQAQAIAAERDRANEIRDFLVGIFDAADPSTAGPEVSARQILDSGRRRINDELAGQPALQAELAMTIGEVYAMLRMTDEWREMLDMELRLRRDLSGTDSTEYADVLIGMSQLEDMVGNYDASEAHARESLAIAERLDEPLAEGQAHKRIGRVLHLKGDYEGAEPHYRRALSIDERELGVDHRETNEVRIHLATLLEHRGDFEESLALLEQALAVREQYLEGDHGELSETYLALGSVLTALARYDDATGYYERAFAMNDRLFGPDNTWNLYVVNGLGKVAEARGDYALAAERYGEAMRLTALHFPDHPNLGIATANLGKTYALDGRCDLAVPVYRDAVDIVARKLPDHWMLGDMQWRLGHCIVKSGGDLDEAEGLILGGLETVRAQWGPDHERSAGAYAAAVELYEARGQPASAARYRPGAEQPP